MSSPSFEFDENTGHIDLRLEAIGCYFGPPRLGLGRKEQNLRKPWVAEITEFDNRFGLRRVFLDHRIDYSRASATQQRGIELVFSLQEFRVYEICSWSSWRKKHQWFGYAWEEGVEEISRDMVAKLLLERMSPWPQRKSIV